MEEYGRNEGIYSLPKTFQNKMYNNLSAMQKNEPSEIDEITELRSSHFQMLTSLESGSYCGKE
jgi:hypothetical protein